MRRLGRWGGLAAIVVTGMGAGLAAGCDSPVTAPGTTTTADAADTVSSDSATGTGVTEDTAVSADTSPADDTTLVEDTAVAADTAVGEDTVDEIPVPGATLTWSNPPSGFSTNHPAWAATGSCSSNQWWTYEGTHESTSMHPGRDCIGCHQDHNGPALRYAGTVYGAVDDADECRGVQGVKVELLRGDDTVAASATTGAGGNFYFRTTAVATLPEYRARLTYQGRTREMETLQTTRSCNTCHGSVGTEDAPGRIVAP